MSSKYLLPCRCGRQITIEPRQAGEPIVCECGTTSHVPSMLEIRALEPAPVESVPPQPGESWGWRQRVGLLGVVLFSAAIIAGVVLHLNRPVSRYKVLPPEELQRFAQKLTPIETWIHWEAAKQGLDRQIDQQYEAAMVRFRIWQAAIVFLALVGAGLIVLGKRQLRASPSGR